MAKSLDEVYQKIEQERQQRMNQQFEQERQAQLIADQRRQEWLRRERMYENISFSQTQTTSSSSGARFASEPEPEPQNGTGEAILYLFTDIDNIYKYVIHNFELDTTTEVISTGLYSSDILSEDSVIITNKGFIKIFELAGSYKLLVIDINGSIIYQLDIVGEYDTQSLNKCGLVRYHNTGLYYMLIYDGTIRTIENDVYMSVGSYFNTGSKNSFIISDDGGLGSWYLIKDGSSDKILLKEVSAGTELNVYTYAYSDTIVAYTKELSSHLGKKIEVFNNLGELILNYELFDIFGTDFADKDNGYCYNYLPNSESDSFIFTLNNVSNSLYYIFYYSSVSNTISYKTISNTYSLSIIDNNRWLGSPQQDYFNKSLLVVFSSTGFDYHYPNDSITYYDNLSYLLVSSTDTTISNFYVFCNLGDSRSKGLFTRGGGDTIRLGDGYANLLVDLNYGVDTNLSIVKVTGSVGVTSSTNIPLDVADWLSQFYLRDRDVLVMDNQLGVRELSFIQDSEQLLTGLTLSNATISSNGGNSFYISDTGEEGSPIRAYYTNTNIGNNFEEAEYYNQIVRQESYHVSDNGLRGDNLLLFNLTNLTGQIITNLTISTTFSSPLQGDPAYKITHEIGESFAYVLQKISIDGSTPDTRFSVLSFYDINGNLIDSIESDSDDINVSYFISKRVSGRASVGSERKIWVFNGTEIKYLNDIPSSVVDGVNPLLNDWYWWY